MLCYIIGDNMRSNAAVFEQKTKQKDFTLTMRSLRTDNPSKAVQKPVSVGQ